MDPDTRADVDFARGTLAEVRRVAVLTGAGISAASGIPTYRGPGGLWTKNPDAEQRSTPPPAKMCDPDQRRGWWNDLWSLWGPLRTLVDTNGPNRAHRALTDWAGRLDALTVITQNVDGLHTAAGTSNVVELHGNIFTTRCVKPSCRQTRWEDRTPWTEAPDCPRCGRPARPDVVLFGESLDRNRTAAAHLALAKADALVVIGTSGNVWPAAELPALAARGGIPTVRIDPGDWAGPHLQWTATVTARAEDVLDDIFDL